MRNSVTIQAVDGGYLVNYYMKNPNYVAPAKGEKPDYSQPKTLYKTKVFTDKALAFAHVEATLADASIDVDSDFAAY